MKWKVVWRRACRDALATFWLDSDQRPAITSAANRIDAQLARDPLGVGESRENGRRILFELPLGVTYKVNASEGKVVVISLWRVS